MSKKSKLILRKLNNLDRKLIEIQMTLDNEISKNISIVAEGHLNLYKKLDNALKTENEKEMLLIRVNRLETELRRIKQRIDEIA